MGHNSSLYIYVVFLYIRIQYLMSILNTALLPFIFKEVQIELLSMIPAIPKDMDPSCNDYTGPGCPSLKWPDHSQVDPMIPQYGLLIQNHCKPA